MTLSRGYDSGEKARHLAASDLLAESNLPLGAPGLVEYRPRCYCDHTWVFETIAGGRPVLQRAVPFASGAWIFHAANRVGPSVPYH